MTKTFSKYHHIYCIGIGGTGVSGLARLLKQSGADVSGSDEKVSPLTEALGAEGFSISIGHSAANMPGNTDLVIFSPAIPENNPERAEARKKNISQLSYPEAVGLLTGEFDTISICGTHGKTTVTAMAAAAFIACGQDPTVIVGSGVSELGHRNERLGKGKDFILESCEHYRNFLHYQPRIIVLNNIEIDHLDYYKNLDDYKSAFKSFIEKLPADGLLIANRDDANVREITRDFTKTRTIFFGKKDIALHQLNLKIPGEHNLLNATAVLTLCSALNLDPEKALQAINNYQGSSRRFQIKGTVGKTIIIDDYAHHPTEIMATLKSVREKYGRDKKVLCIFQPHQYSRTHKLLDGFINAFGDADEIIIPNILRVRDSEEEVRSIDPETLVKKISEQHAGASYGHGLERTAEYVKARLKDYDIVITMGAGDVWRIAEKLLAA